YHAAREQQSFLEGRIKELEAGLSTAEIIDISRLNPGAKVVFGATVGLEDENGGNGIVYQIVGDLEADIKQGRIAVSSPIARADRQDRRRFVRIRRARRQALLRHRGRQIRGLSGCGLLPTRLVGPRVLSFPCRSRILAKCPHPRSAR